MAPILLIEDDAADAEWIASMLEGHVVVVATSMEDGVRLLHERTYDAVLLDLGLPDCGGLESVETVHTFDSHTPIVVLTGADGEALALAAIAAGAHDFLSKDKTDAVALRRALDIAAQRVAVERRRPSTGTAGLARGVVLTPGAPFLDQLSAHIQDAQATLLVAADRPGALLERTLGQRGVRGMKYLDVGEDLTEFAVVVEEAAAGGMGRNVVVDSVNSLLLRYGVDETLLFAHTLANRLRVLGLAIDFVVHENQEWPLVAQRMSFLDGFLHMADPAADPSVV